MSLDDGKSQTETNKHNSVLRSFDRPQVDGKLKKQMESSYILKKITYLKSCEGKYENIFSALLIDKKVKH